MGEIQEEESAVGTIYRLQESRIIPRYESDAPYLPPDSRHGKRCRQCSEIPGVPERPWIRRTGRHLLDASNRDGCVDPAEEALCSRCDASTPSASRADQSHSERNCYAGSRRSTVGSGEGCRRSSSEGRGAWRSSWHPDWSEG